MSCSYLWMKHTHTHKDTGSQTYSNQWITGGWSRPRWRLVLPCDSPHTSTLLSRKLKWKCGPWKSVAPIYPWTRANDLSFLSGAQAAAALSLTLSLHRSAGAAASPSSAVWTHVSCMFCSYICVKIQRERLVYSSSELILMKSCFSQHIKTVKRFPATAGTGNQSTFDISGKHGALQCGTPIYRCDNIVYVNSSVAV